MKSIIYVSNAYDSIFKKNSNSDFKTLLTRDTFSDICSTDILLVGVRAVTFSVKIKTTKTTIIGITSNIVRQHQIENNNLSQLLCTFNLTKRNAKHKHVEFVYEYPIYCQSTIEDLITASFKIFDTTTNQDINDILEETIPLTIELVYKKMSLSENSHFNVFVKSDSLESKKIFNSNTNMEFSILLPERRHLEGKWGVILRDLFLTNQFRNVEKNEFYIKYTQFEMSIEIELDEETGKYETKTKYKVESQKDKEMFMKEGFYQNVPILLEEVNRLLLEMKTNTAIKKSTDINKLILFRRIQGEQYARFLIFSYKLAVVLGFKRPTKIVKDQTEFKLDLNKEMTNNGIIRSSYLTNLNYFYPKQIVINCDLLSNSILGNRQSKILYLMNISGTKLSQDEDMWMLDYPNKIIRPLEIHSFQKMKFWITSLEGKTLNALSDRPTSISLTFVKLT